MQDGASSQLGCCPVSCKPKCSLTAHPNLLALLPLVPANQAARGCQPPPARKEVSKQEHPHSLPMGILQGWSWVKKVFEELLTFTPGSPGTPCKQQEGDHKDWVVARDMMLQGGEEGSTELPVVLRVHVVQGSHWQRAAPSPPCHPRLEGKKGLSRVHPSQLHSIAPHHWGHHLQIQPRSLALVVLGGQGVPVVHGVPWAREDQLSLALLGFLLVPLLPCCPAKGIRKAR